MKEMIDICGGKMKLKDVNREIIHYLLTYKLSRLIVDIKLEDDGYHATLWISNKDFSGGNNA